MPVIFIQLTAVLGIATFVSLLARRLGQPLLVGYIVTGILVGPAVLGIVHEADALQTFGQIGVALLLFLVGLRLQPQMIREVGSIAVITGLGQVIFTSVLGFGLALLFGFSTVPALYLAVAFTFSSTIIILQLLYTKEEQDTLYGRIAIGLMLVQDILAMVIFLFLSSSSQEGGPSVVLAAIILKGFTVLLAVYLLTKYVVPRFDRYFANVRQILFLFALAVCFLFATAFVALGFSFELGALLAGVLLSVSPYQREIASRINTLRDFFLVMFFVVLGTHIVPSSLTEHWPWILGFSVFILVGNPFIVILLMRPFGYTLRTSFYAGLTVAQISEFSLILIATGVTLGHLPATLFGPAAIIGIITILASSYFIMNSRQIFERLQPFLVFVFGRDEQPESLQPSAPVTAVLFGCHRLGSGIVDILESMDLSFIVVDHNPEIMKILQAGGVPGVFGTADDVNFLGSLPVKKLQLVISTIPEIQANLTITQFVREQNRDAVILCVAYHERDAETLYQAGATYVIIPPYLGRRYLMDLLLEYQTNGAGYKHEREKHRRDMGYMRDDIRAASLNP